MVSRSSLCVRGEVVSFEFCFMCLLFGGLKQACSKSGLVDSKGYVCIAPSLGNCCAPSEGTLDVFTSVPVGPREHAIEGALPMRSVFRLQGGRAATGVL